MKANALIRPYTGTAILTFFLCELVQQTGFPDSHIADNDVFEYIGVVVGARSHFEMLIVLIEIFWI